MTTTKENILWQQYVSAVKDHHQKQTAESLKTCLNLWLEWQKVFIRG